MTKTLFVWCRSGDRNSIRRVPMTSDLQSQITAVFEEQEREFLRDVDEYIRFNGSYKPDPNEILFIDDGNLVADINGAIERNPTAYEVLDLENLQDFRIRAVFRESTLHRGRVLIQAFQQNQVLSQRGFTFLLREGVYKKLEDGGFSLGTRLSALIEGNRILFKNFVTLRTILTVQEHFEEATQPQIQEFSSHDALQFENLGTFHASADERVRKLIFGIQKTDVLTRHSADEIQRRASDVGLQIILQDGKIFIPSDKREMKKILSFLEDSVYRGALTEETYLTNSKRLIN